MSYAQGGLIQASDYATFLGTTAASAAAINSIWSTGNGNCGYGQTALGAVSQAGTVTAAQWAGVVNTLNSIRTHQTGSGTGLSAPTAGTLITYLSTVSSSITSAFNDRLTATSQGSTSNQTNNADNPNTGNGVAAQTFTYTRTATFSSADAARYFFNAGGQINFVIGSSTNTGGTTRGGDLVTLASTNFISYSAFKAASGGGRTGTGGTANNNVTNIGYYNLTTSYQILSKITSTTSPYTGDYIQLEVKSNGVQGANADVGTVISFLLTLYSAAQSTYPAPPGNPPGTGTRTDSATTEDAINVTINNYLAIVYPETTNLTSTWGTVTFT
jgi:hypothetical protein